MQSHRILRRRSNTDQALADFPEIASEQPEPPNVYERQELSDRIRSEIQALPETQRVATVLYYINGYSQNDVAIFLQTTPNAVKKQI
jgi:RNA polymerase sigma factor (sigma-70 family)